MTVGPIYWGSYPGEVLEEVMAVLLLQERPDAWHRRPSQGDGGVDVVEPIDGGYHVYQIKRFTGPLDASDRGKIAASFSMVQADPRLDGAVVSWPLVLPCNPTSENEEWFDRITRDSEIKCNWDGETFWNSEASKYPYVIDYFLQDGKQRLLGRVRTLTQLLRDPEAPVRPGDVLSSLSDLYYELDAADPHYRYELHLTGAPPGPREIPRLALSRTLASPRGGFVTVDVIARYGQALQDRPIGGSITFTVLDRNSGIDLQSQLEAHRDFGTPFTIPVEAVDAVVLDAPGGLADGMGGRFEVAVGGRCYRPNSVSTAVR